MHLRPNRREFLTAVGVMALTSGAPTSSVVSAATPLLTIRGRTRDGGDLHLDHDAIWSLGRSAIDTTTPWYQGRQFFEGVRLGALLRSVGALSGNVHFHALNDYEVDVPGDDVDRYDPLLALRRNGADLTVRDKGPIWLVYSFDDHDELRTSRFYARSIWQVDLMEIL